MKLLILAQTPPPAHGQSLMVATLVAGIPAHGIEVHHVNLSLSRDTTDIGRWRLGKVAAVLDACLHAVVARFRHGCDTLYYVPAPGQRGALYRDWMVMLLCRPFFGRLVLHWHAAGLGEWLTTRATAPELLASRLLLGRADLSIVLAESLRADAGCLAPAGIAVVRNGITDPCPHFVRPARPAVAERTAVFIGLGLLEKGILDAIESVRLVNAVPSSVRWRLLLAGEIPDPEFARKIHSLAAASSGDVEHLGFVTGAAKHLLLANADALIFPTYYPRETQGLVVAEALAYDLPVVVTNWRGVAENLPTSHVHLVPPKSPAEIAAALDKISRQGPPHGASRRHFLEHYTDRSFLARMKTALAAAAARSAGRMGFQDDESTREIHRERWQGVWRNLGTSVLARIIAAVCMLAQVPLAMRHLGADGFGVWMALAGFAGLLQISDLGLGISAQNELAAAFGRQDRAAFTSILRRTVRWITIIAAGLGLALAPLCWRGHWSAWLNITDPALAAQMPLAALAALGGFVLNLPLSLAGRVASAMQRQWLNPLGNCVASVGQLIAVVLAVQTGASLVVFVLIGQLGPVLQSLAVLALTRVNDSWTRTAAVAPGDSGATIRWWNSLHFFLPQAAATSTTFILPIALAVLSGPLAVTQVNLLQRIFILLAQAHMMVIGPLWPAYTEAQARGDRVWIRHSFYFSLKITALFLVCCLFAAWLTPWFLTWWLGGQGPAIPAILIAVAALWFGAQIASQPLASLLGGLNHPKGMAIYGTASQVLTVMGACWLGPRYGATGIVSAAAAMALCLNLPAAIGESWWRFQRAVQPPGPTSQATLPLRLPAFLRQGLARRLAGPHPGAARHNLKACIFKVDRIGDFVLATGAIRRLLAAHGEENCLLLVSDTVVDLAAREFPRTPRLTVPPQATGLLREMTGIRRRVRPALGQYRFEQLICLRHQRTIYRDLLLTWIQANRWVGLSHEAPTRKTLTLVDDYALPARYPAADNSGYCRDVLAHRLLVAESLGTPVSLQEIHPHLTGFTVEPSGDFLVLPFSSDPVRNYPAPLLAAALGRTRFNGSLVLSGTSAQRLQLEQLARLTRDAGAQNVQVNTDDASPGALLDRVVRARLVLSMDSAAAHLATVLDRPAVIILGGGEWNLMSPWGPRRRQRWVFNQLPCFNCSWRCQFDRELCLTEISPAVVTQAINDVLALS